MIVEGDSYDILDTLGFRIDDECKQAFIIKFDEESKLRNN